MRICWLQVSHPPLSSPSLAIFFSQETLRKQEGKTPKRRGSELVELERVYEWCLIEITVLIYIVFSNYSKQDKQMDQILPYYDVISGPLGEKK